MCYNTWLIADTQQILIPFSLVKPLRDIVTNLLIDKASKRPQSIFSS